MKRLFLLSALALGACDDGPHQYDEVDAITDCQMMVKAAARDPDGAEIPFVQPQVYSDVFEVAWNRSTKLAHLKNGLGLLVPAEITCRIDRATKRVTYLALNGDVLVNAPAPTKTKPKKKKK